MTKELETSRDLYSIVTVFRGSEVYVELCQTSKMKLLAKIVNGIYLLSILIENSVLDVWKDSE